MNLEDTYRLFVGGYYGISEIDEYDSKVYILKQIKKYIDDFIKEYPIPNFNYEEEWNKLEELPLKRKFQDSLIVLNKINGPIELIIIIKQKLNELED